MDHDQTYDALTIGSGLGALTAAAALAKSGARVLVLERLSYFGGAATIYRREGLTMEASLHETDGATVYGPHGVFAQLGLQDALQPIALDNFYQVRGGLLDSPVTIPHGFEDAHAQLSQHFPDASGNLDKYFQELKNLHKTLQELEGMRSKGVLKLLPEIMSGRLISIVRRARRTVQDQFDRVFDEHEELKQVFGALISYFDDDPSALSHVFYSGIWSRYLQDRSYYFEGGSKALTFALLKIIKDAGGETRRSATVKRILMTQDGEVSGVHYTTEKGDSVTVKAPIILAGVAPLHVASMLPALTAAEFKRGYGHHEPSISLFNIALGLSEPAANFGVDAYSTFVLPDDLKQYRDYANQCARFAHPPGEHMPPYVIADYGRLETQMRQDGDPYLVSLVGVDRFAWWQHLSEPEELERRAQWIEALTDDLNRHYPGIKDAILHSEIATSRTMRTRLGTPYGEVYGFRPTPARLFSRPPRSETSVKGLYLSSAYTVSGGYAGAMHGGMMAANAARSQLS